MPMPEMSKKGNALLESTSSLLVFATQVHKLSFSAVLSKEKLMKYLIHEIKMFEDKIKNFGYTMEVVNAADCFLCSLLDEMIVYSKIGSTIRWNNNELLNYFGGENLDGKDFFTVLDIAMMNPALNLDLLELAYLCLILGFEGKYKEQQKKRLVGIDTSDLINELYNLLLQHKEYEGGLENNLLIQSTLLSHPKDNVNVIAKKHINWGRWLVSGLVIVIGLYIYLNLSAQLNNQASIINNYLLMV